MITGGPTEQFKLEKAGNIKMRKLKTKNSYGISENNGRSYYLPLFSIIGPPMFRVNRKRLSIKMILGPSVFTFLSVCQSVCSGTTRHSFDHRIWTTTYLRSEWPWLNIPRKRFFFLKNYFFPELLPFFLFSLRFISSFEE